jgi:hypothetical protein
MQLKKLAISKTENLNSLGLLENLLNFQIKI